MLRARTWRDGRDQDLPVPGPVDLPVVPRWILRTFPEGRGRPGGAERPGAGPAAQRTLLMARIEKQPMTAQPMETGKTSV